MKGTKRTMRLLAGGLLLLGVGAVGADDWPQWRGPNSNNKVTGFNEPKEWPKALTQKWKVTVGDGLAAPVLVGDKVFTFTNQGGMEVIRCLNAADGKELWTDKYAAPAITGAATKFEVKGPRSGPAVADGKVCTVGVGGTVSCLDVANGKVLWRKDTGMKPTYFVSASPLTVDGACVAYLGSSLIAFDLGSGEAKWTYAAGGAAYGSPVTATLGGVKQVVLATDKSLVGVDPANGKELWKTAFSAGGGGRSFPTATPVVDGPLVIAAGKAFTVEKKDDKFAVMEAWKGQAPHQYNTPVVKDGLLYGFSGTGMGGKLYCQDARTGMVLWTDTATHGGCGYILDAGGVLVALNTDSELLVFKPSKEKYTEVARYKVADSPTWAEPILAGNRVFVKDKDQLILWTIE